MESINLFHCIKPLGSNIGFQGLKSLIRDIFEIRQAGEPTSAILGSVCFFQHNSIDESL